jgi:hypothetical protein
VCGILFIIVMALGGLFGDFIPIVWLLCSEALFYEKLYNRGGPQP